MNRTDFYYREIIKAFNGKTKFNNVNHRLKVLKDCAKSESTRHDNYVMCARDPLYWMNTFGFLEEPRLTSSSFGKIPLVTFDFQDDVLLKIMESIEPTKRLTVKDSKDIWITKCRDMGVSWICIYAFLHAWIFDNDKAFAFLSYKRDMVDKKGDKGTLFTKIKFILDSLPGWMLPNHEWMNTTLVNLDSNNTIISEATINRAFKGNRMSGMFGDEFPACRDEMQKDILACSQYSCDFRIFNGTSEIKDTFYHRTTYPKSSDEVIKLWWWLDPRKTEGLYTDYKGVKRSTWYDQAEERSPSKAHFDREVNLKPVGEGDVFFPEEHVQYFIEKVKDPAWVGDIKLNEFTVDERGPLTMWLDPLDIRPEEYVMGCDVSQGASQSDSVCTIWRKRDLRKVAIYVSNIVDPTEFADISFMLAKKFCDANGNTPLLNFDATGSFGGLFKKRLKERSYTNLFRRVREEKSSDETTEFLGIVLNLEGKRSILERYINFVQKHCIINQDAIAIREMYNWYWEITRTGRPTPRYTNPNTTEKGAGEHGDRTIADALAIWCLPMPTAAIDLIEQTEAQWQEALKNKHKFGIADKPRMQLPYHAIATPFHKV